LGAGVGRDARYFAEQGLEVIAVEPAQEFLKLGQEYTKDDSVQWLSDKLPELSKVCALQLKFDLVLLSAVWMHIPPSQRNRAFRKIANLLKPNGVLVISLRRGASTDEREMFGVSVSELTQLSRNYGLSVVHTQAAEDTLDRKEVRWETVVMRLPDDASSSFPVIRNILINDAKSSTYKLALLRTLLRIADGHPGAVLHRDDESVILPLGLISLYWARQYKLLLDAGIQQSNDPNKGLGFIKKNGWMNLLGFSSLDFSIGNLFIGDDAKSLHKTLKHISKKILDMPAKYITFPNSGDQIFEVEITPNNGRVDSLYLDLDSLKKYGNFRLPVKIWDLLTHYACWIEPVVLNEWSQIMMDYKDNQGMGKFELMQRLEWQDAGRTTVLARNRVESLRETANVSCVWSRRALTRNYDIDHCLPFSRWPNNDLWNLLPSKSSLNRQKRDSIPSDKRFGESKEVIIEWWGNAWGDNHKQRFFTEASLSLPGLGGGIDSLEDAFAALKLQSVRLAEMQQIARW
jgi:SAM-dependent methyltransferase